MPTKHVITSTGIYKTHRVILSSPASRAEYRRYAKPLVGATLPNLLEAVEAAGLRMLREGGAKVTRDKSERRLLDGWTGTSWGMYKFSGHPTLAMQDAMDALEHVEFIRSHIAKGDVGRAVMAGVRLGLVLDRFEVRPVEERDRQRRSAGGIASSWGRRGAAREKAQRCRAEYEKLKEQSDFIGSTQEARIRRVADTLCCSETTVRNALRSTRT